LGRIRFERDVAANIFSHSFHTRSKMRFRFILSFVLLTAAGPIIALPLAARGLLDGLAEALTNPITSAIEA
jgi:hypothetical protein